MKYSLNYSYDVNTDWSHVNSLTKFVKKLVMYVLNVVFSIK